MSSENSQSYKVLAGIGYLTETDGIRRSDGPNAAVSRAPSQSI
jgi:hypothetical protein